MPAGRPRGIRYNDDVRDLLTFCEERAEATFATLRALVEIESPSTDKAAVDRCGAEVARRLRDLGGRVEVLSRERAGDHLLAEFGCGTRQILLLGHFDTVWELGTLKRIPFRVEDGRAYGPGTYDMKGGIAIAMLAIQALLEHAPKIDHRIVVLLTTDEEIGSNSSRQAIEEEARRSEAVLVLEPALAGGGVKTGRKGVGEFELRVTGVAAHAGIDPQAGVSAIEELAHQILRVGALSDPARGISVNVGVIGGGSRTNVIPAEAHASIDLRVPTLADGERLANALQALKPVLPGARLEVSGGVNRPPFERSPEVVRLYTLARDVAGRMGFDLAEGTTGGGSDGNFTAALRVPTLDGLGAVGDGAHAVHEHVLVAEVPRRAALVAGLILRVAGQG